MKPRFLLLALLLALAAPAAHATPPDAAWHARETARIQAHLRGAERQLESRDVSRLAPAQRAARGRALAALRRYRAAGRFPHNHQLPGARTPVFVDGHGTPCAMAYLIAESGSRALAARVAATRNLARIRPLAADPELAAWLRANGMTVAEAARVQPAYEWQEEEPVSDEFVGYYVMASGITTLGNAGLTYLHLRPAASPRLKRAWGGLGMVGGALQTVMGLSAWSDSDFRAPAAFNAGFGAASLVLGARTLLRADAAPPLERQVRLAPGRHGVLAAVPLANRHGVGVAATLRF